MGILNNLKIKLNSKLNNNYPKSMEIYRIYKSNNQKYYAKHKLQSLQFLNKLISCEKKGKDLTKIEFPKNSFNPNNSANAIEQKKKGTISVKELCEKLIKYDIISFDIFDTCIFRPFKKATDLFSLLAKEFEIDNFKDVRIKAEINARAKKKNGEINIFDIYEEILNSLPNSKCDAKKEIELEENVCFANPYMLELINFLKQQNKIIIAVSDMYLPKETILNILNKNGFEFDKIYVSNEYECNKGSGKLFKIVKNDFKNKKIIHIGDNYSSDVLSPKKLKMDSFYYEK